MDLATLIGLIIGLFGLIGGFLMEGGHAGSSIIMVIIIKTSLKPFLAKKYHLTI
jgi:flagellar motor component MotA